MAFNVQLAVREFMKKHNLERNDRPSLVSKIYGRRRSNYIRSEVDELDDAIEQEDLVEIADALADIAVFLYGTAEAYGIQLDECIEEVMRSNMTKTPLDPDGKGGKGEGYEKPNLMPILGHQQRRDETSWRGFLPWNRS